MKLWSYLAAIGATLNLVDAILTIYELENGLITEANPLMAFLLLISVPVFLFFKLFAILFFVVLYTNAHRPLARIGLVVGVLAYVGVFVQHLVGLLI